MTSCGKSVYEDFFFLVYRVNTLLVDLLTRHSEHPKFPSEVVEV